MEYEYKGIELTPAVFGELLIKLFAGKQFSRKDAIDIITKYHLENGGLLHRPSYIDTFKKAAQRLNNEGFLENVGYSVWRLHKPDGKIEIVAPRKKTEDTIEYKADKEIGEGKFSVYVYYFNKYRELAELKGNDKWECKIGRTDVDAISRIMGQSGTCCPEMPHIGLIIHCNNSTLLEKTLHDVLKMRGRWITDSPGKEWFITAPEEIEQIYYSVMV